MSHQVLVERCSVDRDKHLERHRRNGASGGAAACLPERHTEQSAPLHSQFGSACNRGSQHTIAFMNPIASSWEGHHAGSAGAVRACMHAPGGDTSACALTVGRWRRPQLLNLAAEHGIAHLSSGSAEHPDTIMPHRQAIWRAVRRRTGGAGGRGGSHGALLPGAAGCAADHDRSCALPGALLNLCAAR